MSEIFKDGRGAGILISSHPFYMAIKIRLYGAFVIEGVYFTDCRAFVDSCPVSVRILGCLPLGLIFFGFVVILLNLVTIVEKFPGDRVSIKEYQSCLFSAVLCQEVS